MTQTLYVTDHQFTPAEGAETVCRCTKPAELHAVVPTADGGATINVLAFMQDEPEDHETGLKVGDWVTVPGNAQGTAWEAGHVENISQVEPKARDNGWRIWIGYGSRDESRTFWLHGARAWIGTDEVGEIWRQRRALVEEHGIQSSELVWYRVRPPAET